MAPFCRCGGRDLRYDIGHQAVALVSAVGASGRRIVLSLLLATLAAGCAAAQRVGMTATYELDVLPTEPAHISVRATVPGEGARLAMAESRPGDVSELADAGWPALIQQLKVVDAEGRAVGVTSAGAGGWTLARSVRTKITKPGRKHGTSH